MKFLLWEIKLEPYRLAKLQWVLFKLFGIKCHSCGYIKPNYGFCHQPWDVKRCDVINNDKDHRVVCKCCGATRIMSSQYLNPNPKSFGEWYEFDEEYV